MAPPAVRRYPALDGLRALAATAVVVTHVAFFTGHYTEDAVGRVLARGDVGVALFFVLSGFLLSLPMLRAAAEGRPQPPAGPYLWRRALRILPPYWIAVVVALVALPDNRGVDAADWARHLALLQIYDSTWALSGLVHTWSLCTEVAFYAVLPVLVRRLVGTGPWRPRRVLAGLGALGAAGFAWLGWVSADPGVLGPLNLWLPAFLPWFGAGIAFAVLAVSPGVGRAVRELAASPGTCWAGAAVLFWIACTPVAGPLDLTRPAPGEVLVKHALFLGIGALVVAPLVLDPDGGGRLRAALAWRPVAWLGRISYGLFLFHMIVLTGFVAVTGRPVFGGGFGEVLAVTFVGGVLLAAACDRFVERPLHAHLARRPVPSPTGGRP
jgi:peptidoglycan/LPS O-acetylase OafA/YrhL